MNAAYGEQPQEEYGGQQKGKEEYGPASPKRFVGI
jgi:hypothetical protein